MAPAAAAAPPAPPAPAAPAGRKDAAYPDLDLALYTPGIFGGLDLGYPGLQLADPPVLVVNDFLSDQECERVVAKARYRARAR